MRSLGSNECFYLGTNYRLQLQLHGEYILRENENIKKKKKKRRKYQEPKKNFTHREKTKFKALIKGPGRYSVAPQVPNKGNGGTCVAN